MIEGHMTTSELKFLNRVAKRSVLPIVEIGSLMGLSTSYLAKGSLAGNKVPVYAVDPHTGSPAERAIYNNGKPLWTFDIFIKNMKDEGLLGIVKPVVMTSEEAGKNWREPAGVVFIDGDHSYENAVLDFSIWGECLADNGVIAFHDGTNPHFGVEAMIRNVLFKDRRFSKFKLTDGIIAATKIKDPFRALSLLKIETVLFFVYAFRKLPLASSLKMFCKKIIKQLMYQ